MQSLKADERKAWHCQSKVAVLAGKSRQRIVADA